MSADPEAGRALDAKKEKKHKHKHKQRIEMVEPKGVRLWLLIISFLLICDHSTRSSHFIQGADGVDFVKADQTLSSPAPAGNANDLEAGVPEFDVCEAEVLHVSASRI